MPSESDAGTGTTDSYQMGDSVVLVATHHAHNTGLKNNEGRTGSVQTVRSDGTCLVKFEGMGRDPLNRYWVDPKWLSRSEDGGSGQ